MSELNRLMLDQSNERIRREQGVSGADMIRYIRTNNIPPIVAREVHDEDQFALFRNIEPNPPQRATYDNVYRVFNNVRLPSKVNIGGRTHSICFNVGNGSYRSVDRITDYYQENERIKSYNTNRRYEVPNLSVHQLWYNHSDILERVVTASLDYVREKYPNEDWSTPKKCYNNFFFRHNLMSGLYFQGIYTSQYRVTWVVSIIQFFRQFINIESILDPFAGWGDRLIGALKLGISYQGYDPNSALHPGYQRMIKDFTSAELSDTGTMIKDFTSAELSGGREKKYVVDMIGFEDAVIDRQFDLVLTSPPYGSVEIYSEECTQSIIKFRDNWMQDFYIPSLLKAWNSLRVGGIFILHVCDTRTFLIVSDSMKFFNSISGCKHLGQFMAYTHKSNYPNLHLVYQKEWN